MKWFILATILIIGFVCCMGCMNNQDNSIMNGSGSGTKTIAMYMADQTPVPTQTNIPTIVTTIPKPTPIPALTPTVTEDPTPVPTEEEPIPDWTEAPTVYPTVNPDVNSRNYSTFSSNDFLAIYPDTWTVINETFTLKDTTLFNIDTFKQEGRSVSFVSEDGNVSMKVTVYDFISPDRTIYVPTIDLTRRTLQKLYPNASADTFVYNYQNLKSDRGLIYQSYDIVFKPDAEYYPLSYTEWTFRTKNHYFIQDFTVKSGDLLGYNDLRALLMESIKTESLQGYRWW